MSDFNLVTLLPEIFLAITAMGLLIVGVQGGVEAVRTVSWASVIGMGVAILIMLCFGWEAIAVLNGMFIFDGFAGFMKILILFGLMLSLALAVNYLEDEGISRAEYPILVMLAGIGMMLMVSANNMLSLYMALELQSLSLYVLAGFHRNVARSAEAGVKYFTLGALSSGMLLFGISLLYGFTGSLEFSAIAEAITAQTSVSLGLTVGLVFVLAGLAFKISAVPFHMWTPDVYQGAPTSVTALFAIVPKVAALALLIRLLHGPFGGIAEQWSQIIYFLALGSMIVGAFAALAQNSVKRLMAYSSIGNMGYALIGLVVATPAGVTAVVTYLFIYVIMTAGVFAVILSMRRNGIAVDRLSDLAGLSTHSPFLAYVMAIMMFSMAGIPPLAGFFGKLLVFQAAMAEGYVVLATLGVVSSVVAAYYYLRIVKIMFFDAAADPFDKGIPAARRLVLVGSLLFVLGFVLKPSIILAGAQNAAAVLF